jgi:hypothetical protein
LLGCQLLPLRFLSQFLCYNNSSVSKIIILAIEYLEVGLYLYWRVKTVNPLKWGGTSFWSWSLKRGLLLVLEFKSSLIRNLYTHDQMEGIFVERGRVFRILAASCPLTWSGLSPTMDSAYELSFWIRGGP